MRSFAEKMGFSGPPRYRANCSSLAHRGGGQPRRHAEADRAWHFTPPYFNALLDAAVTGAFLVMIVAIVVLERAGVDSAAGAAEALRA